VYWFNKSWLREPDLIKPPGVGVITNNKLIAFISLILKELENDYAIVGQQVNQREGF
jgi:hypothetical protein